jgi:hypothetical protein
MQRGSHEQLPLEGCCKGSNGEAACPTLNKISELIVPRDRWKTSHCERIAVDDPKGVTL